MPDPNPPPAAAAAPSGSSNSAPPPVIIPNTVNPPRTAGPSAGGKPKMIFKPVVPIRKREA